MKHFYAFLLLATALFAQNPKVYSALGDNIYDNVGNIEKIKSIAALGRYHGEVDQYLQDVETNKQLGFAIENGQSDEKKTYLNNLRGFSKKYDYFLREVKTTYRQSMQLEDHEAFSQTINSGLIDVQKHKQEIKDYYIAHSQDINATGVIQTFLDEDEKLRLEREARLRAQPTAEELRKAKLRRIRENDQLKQERLQKSLEEEVIRKKHEIREYQQEELTR